MSTLTAQQWNDLYPVGTVVEFQNPWPSLGAAVVTVKTQGSAWLLPSGVAGVALHGFGSVALSLLTPIEPEPEPEVRLEDCILLVRTGQTDSEWTLSALIAPGTTGLRCLAGRAILDAVAPLIERSKKT